MTIFVSFQYLLCIFGAQPGVGDFVFLLFLIFFLIFRIQGFLTQGVANKLDVENI